MALIKCPECGREVSNKASLCIHCGFPLAESTNEDAYDIYLTGISSEAKSTQCLDKIIGLLMDITHKPYIKLYDIIFKKEGVLVSGLSYANAIRVSDSLQRYGLLIDIQKGSFFDSEHNVGVANVYNIDDAPVICPRCKSTSITTGARGFSFLSGFIGSNKTVNRCAKCGYTWQPK